ncbi:complement component C8 gamma chain [Thalassophryne amazonica]|uniref:complement component C8 gamma chain n=1 Tax=Thalassophryne amazonica TaxID=390379 RepID=UPI001470A9EF|nr:complement component C8 gamma chain [Thalassophryne amazonica]
MAAVWRRVVLLAVLTCVCLWGSTEGIGGAKSRPRPQRRPRKKPKIEPVDQIVPAQNIDLQQMSGTWYLLNTASKCSYLVKHGTKVEPTVMVLSAPSDQKLTVSTKTRHNHQCWEIRQVYHLTTTPGRLTLKGLRPELNTEIIIGDTDYSSYAVVYYQKRGEMTLKLYGRSVDNLSEPVLTKFEQLAEKQGFGLAFLFPFPTYSHCGLVDEDHVISKFRSLFIESSPRAQDVVPPFKPPALASGGQLSSNRTVFHHVEEAEDLLKM